LQQETELVKFEVLTAVNVRIALFWDVTPCSVLLSSSGWRQQVSLKSVTLLAEYTALM
jgi:hypothetical protein